VGSFIASASETNNGRCATCPAGKYQGAADQQFCHPCPEGTYSNKTGQVAVETCQECPEGTFSDSGSVSEDSCNGRMPTFKIISMAFGAVAAAAAALGLRKLFCAGKGFRKGCKQFVFTPNAEEGI
jgi:hypothetical protein